MSQGVKKGWVIFITGVKGETTVGLYHTLSCDLLAHLGQGDPQDNLQRGQPSLGDYLGLSTFCFELNCGCEAKHLYKLNEVQLLSFLKLLRLP